MSPATPEKSAFFTYIALFRFYLAVLVVQFLHIAVGGLVHPEKPQVLQFDSHRHTEVDFPY